MKNKERYKKYIIVSLYIMLRISTEVLQIRMLTELVLKGTYVLSIKHIHTSIKHYNHFGHDPSQNPN